MLKWESRFCAHSDCPSPGGALSPAGLDLVFINILNKKPDDHKNFLKAYELFANHYDDIAAIKKIDRKTLVMTGSDDLGSTPEMSKELVKDLVNSSYIEIKNG